MNRITYFVLVMALTGALLSCANIPVPTSTPAAVTGAGVEHLLMQDYRPVSVYQTPRTVIEKAKYPVIDMHSHTYALSEGGIDQAIQNMDAVGISQTIILTKATGTTFDSIYAAYAPYGDRFEIWCGFDYTGYDKPGYGPAAVAELERCYNVGARGVGELSDKGSGLVRDGNPADKLHLDDPRLD